MPFGRVPFRTMVEVPFTSATVTTLWFRFAHVPSPIKESRKVELSGSSQPQDKLGVQRQLTGLLSCSPVSCLPKSWNPRAPIVGVALADEDVDDAVLFRRPVRL